MSSVTVDITAVNELAKQIEEAQEILIGRLGERGYQLLRDEVPKETTNLQQGVAVPDVDYKNLTAVLTVSARSATAGATTATVYLAGGKTKQVALRPQKPYNYAEVVARGNKDAVLTPKKAKAFLIPITGPAKGGVLEIGGKYYVMRRSRKGKAANPYDDRAAARLDNEMVGIAEAVLREVFQ